MELDINRLHDVILGNINYKGCGKTIANLYELLGVLQTTKEDEIICLFENSKDLLDIKPKIVKLLTKKYCKKLKINQKTKLLFENGVQLYLITNNQKDPFLGLQEGTPVIEFKRNEI